MSSAGDALKANFTLVFKENRWGNAESVSGGGSALSSPSVLPTLPTRTVFDPLCGWRHWRGSNLSSTSLPPIGTGKRVVLSGAPAILLPIFSAGALGNI